jgi:hypothetical protein
MLQGEIDRHTQPDLQAISDKPGDRQRLNVEAHDAGSYKQEHFLLIFNVNVYAFINDSFKGRRKEYFIKVVH